MRLFCKLLLSVLLAASVTRAQTPSTDAPAKTEPATPAPDSAQAPKADAPRPYVESALTFLRAFTHTNRTGPEGEKALVIDAAAGHSNAMLVRFAKVSTWREALDIQGVTIEKTQLRVGDEEHSGKARLKLAEKDGKWIVESFEVE